MDKKQYMKPLSSVYVLNTGMAMMAGSLEFDDNNETGSGQVIDEDASGPGLSRRGNIWDDDTNDQEQGW